MRLSTSRLLITLVLGVLMAPLAADAQPMAKGPRIGYLSSGYAGHQNTHAILGGLRQGLGELGWVEGQNLAIEARYAEEHTERLPALAAELMRLQVDALFAIGPAAVRAAVQATRTVPIVAIDLETDPVASGLVASLGRPRGNLTGMFLDMPELSGKWLELLQEALARPTRIAVLGDPTINASQFSALAVDAQRKTVLLQLLEVRGPDELERAMEAASTGDAGALILLPSPMVDRHGRRLAKLAAQRRLPAISPFPSFTEAGGLLAYGPNATDMIRRCAVFVDKILKGATPADLPIERPTKFELVINLKTAQALGLSIPPTLLIQATKVIQ
jgi:putative ABC transport system substrate-binding protein